jgi:hypothetical protein
MAMKGSEETPWHGVFTDPGVLTTGQKIPKRSVAWRRNGPKGKRPESDFNYAKENAEG